MLDSHPAIAVTPETHFGERYLPGREDGDREETDRASRSGPEVWTSSGALDRFCASAVFGELAIDERVFRHHVAALSDIAGVSDTSDTSDISDISDRPWDPLRVAMEDYARLRNASIVGEKTPSHSLHLDALAEAFPRARFLILVRDPRAVAASWHRASWSKHSTVQIAETWSRYRRAARRAMRRMDSRCLEVAYEDLVSKPTQILEQICAFLGTDFDSQMLRYPERSVMAFSSEERADHVLTFELPQPARIAAWHSSLRTSDLRQIEAICARPMVRRGYRLETSILERIPDQIRWMPRSWRKRIKHRLRRLA
jgi:hypothetical protein